jgi:hypothetical protein
VKGVNDGASTLKEPVEAAGLKIEFGEKIPALSNPEGWKLLPWNWKLPDENEFVGSNSFASTLKFDSEVLDL